MQKTVYLNNNKPRWCDISDNENNNNNYENNKINLSNLLEKKINNLPNIFKSICYNHEYITINNYNNTAIKLAWNLSLIVSKSFIKRLANIFNFNNDAILLLKKTIIKYPIILKDFNLMDKDINSISLSYDFRLTQIIIKITLKISNNKAWHYAVSNAFYLISQNWIIKTN